MPLSIMIFMFLFFIGLAIMFIYLLRSQERFQADMRDEHAQMRIMLRTMESRITNHSTNTHSAESAAKPSEHAHTHEVETQITEKAHANSGPLESLSMRPADDGIRKRSNENGLKINFG